MNLTAGAWLASPVVRDASRCFPETEADGLVGRSHLLRRTRLTAMVLVLAGLAGCAPEVRWRGLIFEPVFRDAQRDQKVTFVYLRNWYMPACTEFEKGVLRDPEVVQAAEPLYCAKLEFDYATSYVKRWGVSEPPAIVLLDPQGRVLARLSAPIDRQALLDAIAAARAKVEPPPATAPAAPSTGGEPSAAGASQGG
ncbi:MAG: hypothetical protein D6744_04870 [Planctomycetota bacterium]|nr:MAG: hypothetical protein D6744_04870 [Planctomycetota bacterium]